MANIHITPRTLSQLILFLFLFSAPSTGQCTDHKNYFPQFQCITDNVTFWEKVYEEYSINTAILHDREDLTIIYEIIPLVDRTLPGAAKINKAYLDTIKNKYIFILDRLAAGNKPANSEEKRILGLFSSTHPRGNLKNASQNLRIQTGLKEQFQEGVVRSGAYMVEMKKIFKSYNLPEELAYLPHVESSFNIQAYSKFGAAGVWQFTRSTGKNYMTIDDIMDERRDPLIATHAAAQYLKRNFDNLGTWPLAITAYNYGHAGMWRAVQQEGTYVNIFNNYRQGHFKFASRNFYSEFLAALNVAKKLEQHPAIIKESPFPNFDVSLTGFASAADLAGHFGLSQREMRRLNPSLADPIWQEEKFIPDGFQLRLPHNPATLRLAENIPNSIYRASQKRAQVYHVKAGDTAGKIARRFGISLTSLSRANSLNGNAMVYIGQALEIPSISKIVVAEASGKAGNAVILKETKKTPPT
jgi:membrane-bound lytic murein transglycosylase D